MEFQQVNFVRLLIFQHTIEETPGTILDWLDVRKIPFEIYHTYLGYPQPDPEKFDSLIVLGGPMNLDQTTEYPWLALEKKYISDWIKLNKKYLGICLGGQLLAQALGAEVGKNLVREIGFHQIEKLQSPAQPDFFQDWPSTAIVAQWHEDRFTLPPGTNALWSSVACKFQAFQKGDRILALQFHPEATQEWMLGNYVGFSQGTHEPYVQPPELCEFLQVKMQPVMKNLFFQMLDRFFLETHKKEFPNSLKPVK